MRSRRNFRLMMVCLLLIAALPACRNEKKAAGTSGKTEIDLYAGREIEPVYSKSFVKAQHSRYVLEPALQGDIVRHDFIIKNDSGEVLELRDAEGCCGTIVESYARTIPPGMTGNISVLFLTDSRGGEEINGTIRARTSDENRPDIIIDVSLYVKEFAALHPYRIWLKGSSGEEIVEKCLVIPNAAYPFNITGIRTRKGVWFEHGLREIEKEGRKAYEITVRNTRNKPGPYQDVLFVQTDSSARPEFKIRVEGRITE